MSISTQRIDVLLKLAYNGRLPFSKLWDRNTPSNRFTYHLKELQKDGLIRKVSNGYVLTAKGEKAVAHLSEEGYETKEQPIVGIIIVAQRKGDLLVSLRKREPFKGYHGFTHGRISLGEGIEDAAKRILKERAGLEGRMELKGMWIVNTVRDGKILFTHHHFIMRCPVLGGDIKKETRDFSNFWVQESSLGKLKRFYDDDYILKITKKSGFTMIEADRFQEGDELKGIRIRKKYEFEG